MTTEDEQQENGRKKVLLVEDHADNRAIYSIILEHGGFQIRTAEDGAEGVAAAREWMPDLILMDISLPGMDGISAARELKADPQTQNICIVALTALVFKEDRARADDAGFDGYLTKPIEPKQVLAEVRRLLDSY